MTKRVGNLMPRICSLPNLHEAFLRSVRGRSGKQVVVRMRDNLDAQLLEMRRQLLSGRFVFGQYSFFEIFDQKRRTICAASFPERVAFQAMMRICHPVFEDFQTNDSFASRRGRGQYKALERAQQLCGRYQWFAKMDVCKFFDSIHHEVMLSQLCRLFKDPLLLLYFQRIIQSYATDTLRGLPIGNLTSQYFANHYMAVADHYAKEHLHIPAMVRYMDDVLIFADSHEELMGQAGLYGDYVNSELRLRLHEPVVNRTRTGIPFLGYVVFPDRLRLSGRSQLRFRRKMQRLTSDLQRHAVSEKEYAMRAQCLVAFTNHADSLGFRIDLGQRYQGIYP